MRLAGTCNRCGACCKWTYDGVPAQCENLRTLEDGLTACAVWEHRVDHMPIRLLGPAGELVAWETCRPEFPHGAPEGMPLPAGCSYEWVP